MPSYEYRGGKLVEVPDVVISESSELHEDIDRTLVIQSGVTLTTHGRVNGTVQVQHGGTFIAHGDVNGTVDVDIDAEATFHRGMGGTLNVRRGGVATLAQSATALGTMTIDGTLINHGTRGLQVRGTGVVQDREGSTIRPPDEIWEDGTAVYFG